MKILSNKSFNDLMTTLVEQNKVIKRQEKLLISQMEQIQKLKSQHNSPSDLIYPNTDERGLTGEAETPINFSDIIEL